MKVGNASNVSVNDDIVPPSTFYASDTVFVPTWASCLPDTPSSVPKIKIVIHQVPSVPFVGGELGLRGRFKSVQTPNPQNNGLFQSRNGSRSDQIKGREDAGAKAC